MNTLMLAAALVQQGPHAPAIPAQPAPAITASRPDPVHAEAAKRVAHAVWPVGTLARMYASGAGFEAADSLLPGMMDIARTDPHYAERMRITRRLMAEEYQPIAARQEPFIRAALAEAYARRFDTAQLQAAATFFASPAGRAIAAETQLMPLDPAILRLVTPSLADSFRIMASVQKKLEGATRHLPKRAARKQAPPGDPSGYKVKPKP